MKLNTVLTIMIFSLRGFVFADSNSTAPEPNPLGNLQAVPPAKRRHGPDTLQDRPTKIESVRPLETKSLDLPKESETHHTHTTQPTGWEAADAPKSAYTAEPKKSDRGKSSGSRRTISAAHTAESKKLDRGKSSIPHRIIPAVHTAQPKKSDGEKSSSLHRTTFERTKQSGFTTHHRVTVSTPGDAPLHTQTKGNSESLGGIMVRLQLFYILFHCS